MATIIVMNEATGQYEKRMVRAVYDNKDIHYGTLNMNGEVEEFLIGKSKVCSVATAEQKEMIRQKQEQKAHAKTERIAREQQNIRTLEVMRI